MFFWKVFAKTKILQTFYTVSLITLNCRPDLLGKDIFPPFPHLSFLNFLLYMYNIHAYIFYILRVAHL